MSLWVYGRTDRQTHLSSRMFIHMARFLPGRLQSNVLVSFTIEICFSLTEYAPLLTSPLGGNQTISVRIDKFDKVVIFQTAANNRVHNQL